MSKKKSPLDDLFFELFGYYPNKAGQAYELLVASAIKLITDQEIKYDQHLRGAYSKTDYQIDALNVNDNKIIEAKDYTIDNRKVGRSDLQKLQGALTDLNVQSGLFASATDYTSPAKKYAPLWREYEAQACGVKATRASPPNAPRDRPRYEIITTPKCLNRLFSTCFPFT